MTIRGRLHLAIAAWAALVAGSVVGAMLTFRNRLPNPLATHWGPHGRPDAALSFTAAVVAFLLLWGALAAIAVVAFSIRDLLLQRNQRAWLGAVLGGAGGLILALAAVTINANLDRTNWTEARPVGLGQVALAFAAGGALAVAGAMLARRGPHIQHTKRQAAPRRLQIAADEHAVWVSRVTNRHLAAASVLLLLAAATTATAALLTLPRWVMFAIPLPLAVIALAAWSVSTIRVAVNRHGLTVAYGPWAWPKRRTPLHEITQVWTEHRTPAQVGGWGYRGLPGANSTLMVRPGPCLVIRRRSGAEFAVSVDDADQGAALLDTLRRQLHGVA